MKHIKSERLKKLESELNDLEQWLKLGLVPAKDIEKHKQEIRAIREKIDEEKDRLKFLKESGEMEEYTTPKRSSVRTAYTEMPTMPDIDIAEAAAPSEVGFDMASDAAEMESSIIEEHSDKDDTDGDDAEEEADTETKDEHEGEGATAKDEDHTTEDESYFSDRNRWRRGGIIDPEANDW
jgi:hypothetical protein